MQEIHILRVGIREDAVGTSKPCGVSDYRQAGWDYDRATGGEDTVAPWGVFAGAGHLKAARANEHDAGDMLLRRRPRTLYHTQ